MNSYFEIGGKLVECILDEPDISHHGRTTQQRKVDRILMKQGRGAVITALEEKTSYDVKRGLRGAGKARQGTRTIGRGLAIAGALAAIDGPLPFGDVLAAGFLIGGGAYMTYTGVKDVLQ